MRMCVWYTSTTPSSNTNSTYHHRHPKGKSPGRRSAMGGVHRGRILLSIHVGCLLLGTPQLTIILGPSRA
jgi:hypothetical protein